MINKLKFLLYNFLNPGLKLLKKLENNKLKIANIGSAGEEDFAGMFWTRSKNFSKYYYFDPDNDQAIISENTSIFPYGLWDKEDIKEIFITKFPYASSFFEPNKYLLDKFINRECHEVVKKKKINLKMLDDVIFNKNDYCDFIKIDAEGSELKILNGAKQNLSNAFGVEVEINFLEKNIDSPHACEVISYLKNYNYELFILSRESWKKNKKNFILGNYQLVWADAIFFRTEKNILSELLNLSKEERETKILKLLALFLMYRLYDTADNYLKYFKKNLVISQIEYKNFKDILNKNIENSALTLFKTVILLVCALLFVPFSFITFSKKLIFSNLSFIKILLTRLITLILNLFRYSGPNKVSVSDSIKNL